MPIRNVADAMHEAEAKGWGRKQAIAIGLKARRHLSKAQRAMRDRSTKGSPPMTHPELAAGYRRCD